MKRKVCVVVASRANYGRIKYVMRAVQQHPDLELQLIVGASTLLERYGRSVDIIRREGFEPDRSIFYVVEGETPLTQAKSTGLGIVELSTAFQDLQPDMVVTVADRYETMSSAIAASYMNIPLVHVQGGEVSGNIDDRVRHAITKLADIHFPCTEQSRERLIRMGEDEHRVFNHGCPAMDVIANEDTSIDNEIMAGYGGVGTSIDWTRPYILMVQHPVTTSYGDGMNQVMETLHALCEFPGHQKVVLWPNSDAGSEDVAKGIRVFRERGEASGFHFYRNFSPEDYVRVLANAKACVGNSSSFIREGSFLGVPAVVVGDRQRNREHGGNVVFADYTQASVKDAIERQLAARAYEHDSLFGFGDAGRKIADTLATIDLNYQKSNSY
ncbi:UDP-N-acetylglucosamine 2-epimerase [Marinobacterium aestuariivivens]|uniref:UDP-N-acetylglucosamine 2-epimerase n=1 Tax=Marinobacterium aestuariivivens TaxID=1698799 RepID=A0ABW1ZYP7_9GAMM